MWLASDLCDNRMYVCIYVATDRAMSSSSSMDLDFLSPKESRSQTIMSKALATVAVIYSEADWLAKEGMGGNG